MLGGNISNRQAPIIAFNIDELLFNDTDTRDLNIVQKLKWRMMSDPQKFLNRPLNKEFISIIDHLWNKYTYSIYFITFREDMLTELYEVLDRNNVSYTSLVPILEWDDLRRLCALQYTYYFDRNLELLSYIGNKNALHIDQLPTLIK